jgi:hypothetical protein
MPEDEPNLLKILRAELKFIEGGNYRRPPRSAWRPQLVFEDSPTCMNYTSPEKPPDCSHCPLMQFVPPNFRSAQTPCRHIPLNAAGETLGALYGSADQAEIEATVARWIRSAIQKLEAEKQTAERNYIGREGNCAHAPDIDQQHLCKRGQS